MPKPLTLASGQIRQLQSGETLDFGSWTLPSTGPTAAGHWLISSASGVATWYSTVPDNVLLKFGTGSDASIYYDGAKLVVSPADVGTGEVYVNGDIWLDNNKKLELGANKRGAIYHDGTQPVITAGADYNVILLSSNFRISNNWNMQWGSNNVRIEGNSSTGKFRFVSPTYIDFYIGSAEKIYVCATEVRIGTNLSLNADNRKLFFGVDDDASIYYDGTDLIVDPKEAGSGIVDIQGTLQTDGYNSSDGSAGISCSFNVDDGTGTLNTLTFKNGLLTNVAAVL